MPRGLENWLAVGFTLVLAPLIVSACIGFSDGSLLAWAAVAVILFLFLLAFDATLGARMKLAQGGGRFAALGVAVLLLGYGGYELFSLYGQGQSISPLPDTIVTLGWLCAIAGSFLIFFMLNSGAAKDHFAK